MCQDGPTKTIGLQYLLFFEVVVDIRVVPDELGICLDDRQSRQQLELNRAAYSSIADSYFH